MSELVFDTVPLIKSYVRLKIGPFDIEANESPVIGRCHVAKASLSAPYIILRRMKMVRCSSHRFVM